MIGSRLVLSTLLMLSAAGCVRRDHSPPPGAFIPPPQVTIAAQQERAALEAEVERLRLWLIAREARIQEIALGEAALTQQLQDVSLMNDEMGERLRLSSSTLEQLATERERLLADLAAAQAKLLELDSFESTPGEPPPSPELPPATSPPELVPNAAPAGEVAVAPDQE